MAENITEVRLLSVPLEKDYIHTFYFTSPEAQLDFFLSQAHKPFTNLSYQRKDGFIRIPAQYDTILQYNYVMYRNAAYSSKWFFAFITDSKYVDDGRTDVYIETDVIQTWLSSCTIKPSFVEREHAASDTIGEHTVPEQLETGDYICNKHTKADYTKSYNMIIVVGVTKTPDGENVRGTYYDNIYSGIAYYTFEHNREGIQELNYFLNSYPEEGAAEAITCMFLAPNNLTFVRENHTIAGSNTVKTNYINHGSGTDIDKSIDITDDNLNGYTPKNNKLMCYPYRYLLTSNNNGAAAIYKFELFYNLDTKAIIAPQFKIEGCLTPGCSVRMYPTNYNGAEKNDSESISLGKYPILNWTSDVYTNWLTQNAINIPMSIGTAVVTTTLAIAGAAFAPVTGGASAVATIGAIGAAASGITSIASTLSEKYQHSLQPPQAEGNINCGDVITAAGDNDFHFYDMSIKAEYAKIIDDYFTMFGYKINRVKVPSVGHRENFWYVKTIDANIDGAIPPADLQKIKDCYNRGITFWKNPAIIGNYQVSNKTTT